MPRFRKWLLLLILPLLAGCANSPTSNYRESPALVDRGVVMDVSDPSLQPYAAAWAVEIARRFPSNTVGCLLHGGCIIDNQWVVLSKPGTGHPIELMADFIREEQRHYPGQRLVILACNVGHIQLHGFDNVWFSPDLTWCLPDRAVEPDTGEEQFKMLNDVRPFLFDEGRSTFLHNRWADDPLPCGNIWEFLSAE
jgi:hypothetical protein